MSNAEYEDPKDMISRLASECYLPVGEPSALPACSTVTQEPSVQAMMGSDILRPIIDEACIQRLRDNDCERHQDIMDICRRLWALGCR